MPVAMLPPRDYRPIGRGHAFVESVATTRRNPIKPPLERHARTRTGVVAMATGGRSAVGSFLAVELLALAYERPCLICERTGWCSHREPDVELALLGAVVERGR